MQKKPKTNSRNDRDQTPRLLEIDEFPFEFLSALAERESWRKEVYRPVYHVHKWWANRLGSVFRGILLGALLPPGSEFETQFYSKHNFGDVAVLDPFMGSGTTVGEAHKLGCVSFGQDINPVACESVRVAFGPMRESDLRTAYLRLEQTIGESLRDLYKAEDSTGRQCDVLYYFWVKTVDCPKCSTAVELFSSRVIAAHAYPQRYPEVQLCCPKCRDIFSARSANQKAQCPSCHFAFDPLLGSAAGSKATCSACNETFPIAQIIRQSGKPPQHRLYAKLVLTPEGDKKYLRATAKDLAAYESACEELAAAEATGAIQLPRLSLTEGYNTKQAIGYNYLTWRDFFNARQLLALGRLQKAIAGLPDANCRDALLTLFSGVLEFNNSFVSFKGEGTGAVRHMFSHHVLKPERTPIEANVWGTPKSSGSFSNLFKSRLLRAAQYQRDPFEVALGSAGKKLGCNPPFSGEIQQSWPAGRDFTARGIYLACGSSTEINLPDNAVDLIVTDPPFFDNVHYSELADFFHAWETLFPRGFIRSNGSTRHPNEVQDGVSKAFAAKLQAVFRECYRVLTPDGLLAFTYHHSRAEGWAAVAEAIYGAGFSVLNVHPVKSEMSVAAPKTQAKHPIQLDAVLVCGRAASDHRPVHTVTAALSEASHRAIQKTERLRSIGLKLSLNDCRVIFSGQLLAAIGPASDFKIAVEVLSLAEPHIARLSEQVAASDATVDVGPRQGLGIRERQESFSLSGT